MAEMREDQDASTWLQLKADDHGVAELDKGVLDHLESHYGRDALPDVIEEKLRSDVGADFGTAADEQIFATVQELAQGEQVGQAEEPAADVDPGMPSDEEMVAAIVAAMVEDSEFKAALEAQLQPVDVPESQAAEAADELVRLISESMWEGLVEAMAEYGDTEPATTPTESEMDAAVAEIRS